jgi:hypothetical protein
MGENETEKLSAERARALDVYKPTGALLTSEYLERKQELVAVNRNDLEDILGFDGMSAFFGGLGMFLLSGSSWMLVDKITAQDTFKLTTAIGICAVCLVAGVAFMGAGLKLHSMKRGRIKRIFDETKKLV